MVILVGRTAVDLEPGLRPTGETAVVLVEAREYDLVVASVLLVGDLGTSCILHFTYYFFIIIWLV